jgi:hypothetical protein
VLYTAFLDTAPRALLVGCRFAGFTLVISAVVFGIAIWTGSFEESLFGLEEGGTVGLLAAGVVIVFGLAVLFQWIYGKDFSQETITATSYIFVVDDSGSMGSNDPLQERYAAIETVLADQPETFPYMVYGFSNSVSVLRDMAPIAEGHDELYGNSTGGTAIRGALERVLEDYQNGTWDGGAYPKVILLTDGYATDIGLFHSIRPLLKEYKKAQISISTVGLGSVDNSLMERIAQRTGGVFVNVTDAASLSAAMMMAAEQYVSRDLFSERYVTTHNGLYGFLRVLFLTILGVCIGLVATLACGRLEEATMTLIATGVTALLGACIVEFGIELLHLPAWLAWLLLWTLLAMTFTVQDHSIVPRQFTAGTGARLG